jgi:hypothetical protein
MWKIITILIFPLCVLFVALERVWIEVKNIPFLVWCDVRAEWGSFMAAMRA